MPGQRWRNRPEGSNWGDFGPDDQLGRLNLLTPEKVLQGIAEVRDGKTFCLSLPLDFPGGNVMNTYRLPPKLKPSNNGGLPNMNYPIRLEKPGHVDVFNDDVVELNLQYSTQWDSLAHVGQLFDADGDGVAEIVYYNGFRAGEHILGTVEPVTGAQTSEAQPGARALGVELMATSCIQGRGVMIDFEANYGRKHKLVGYDDLMGILEADRVVIEEGDIVCIRTGVTKMLYEMNKNPDAALVRHSFAKLDGRDERILQWVTDTGLVAIVCDNNAVEASPSRPCNHEDCALLPLHAHCLFKLGVYLGEFWDLDALADWLREQGRKQISADGPAAAAAGRSRIPGHAGRHRVACVPAANGCARPSSSRPSPTLSRGAASGLARARPGNDAWRCYNVLVPGTHASMTGRSIASVRFENKSRSAHGRLAPDNADLVRKQIDGVAAFGYTPDTAAARRERNAAFF